MAIKHLKYTFLLIIFLLAACATLQEARYNTATLYCEGTPITVKLPAGMPDFTNDDSYEWDIVPLSIRLRLIIYFKSDGLDSTSRYGFVVLFDKCGVYCLVERHDNVSQYWIYRKGLPIPASEDAFNQFCKGLDEKEEI